MNAEFLGLRTVKYRALDLARARDWYTAALGLRPYFDQPFYVGFNVGGYALGLDPDPAATAAGEGSVMVYWEVRHADLALARLLELGALTHASLRDVGHGIRVASVLDPFGNVLGLIENPPSAAIDRSSTS